MGPSRASWRSTCFTLRWRTEESCPGYSTEKVWLSLIRGSVPVYYGGKEVLEMMPTPESYVDLKKFDSPEALAARLYEIATDPKAYWGGAQVAVPGPHDVGPRDSVV